jgi:carbamoylphosphate synthase large subunit
MKVAKKRVLLTYSWNRVGYNILRALSDHGYDVYSADIVKTNICSVSNRSKESLVYHDPFKEEDLFIEDILTIIEKYKIDILLPTHDEGLILSKYKDRFPSDIILAVEDENKLNKLSDKAISTILFKNLGLPVPECFKLSDVTNELYPLIVKGIVGNSSKNVFKVRDKKDLDQALSQLNGQDYLIQSFIGSCDYSVDCVRFVSKFY